MASKTKDVSMTKERQSSLRAMLKVKGMKVARAIRKLKASGAEQQQIDLMRVEGAFVGMSLLLVFRKAWGNCLNCGFELPLAILTLKPRTEFCESCTPSFVGRDRGIDSVWVPRPEPVRRGRVPVQASTHPIPVQTSNPQPVDIHWRG